MLSARRIRLRRMRRGNRARPWLTIRAWLRGHDRNHLVEQRMRQQDFEMEVLVTYARFVAKGGGAPLGTIRTSRKSLRASKSELLHESRAMGIGLNGHRVTLRAKKSARNRALCPVALRNSHAQAPRTYHVPFSSPSRGRAKCGCSEPASAGARATAGMVIEAQHHRSGARDLELFRHQTRRSL